MVNWVHLIFQKKSSCTAGVLKLKIIQYCLSFAHVGTLDVKTQNYPSGSTFHAQYLPKNHTPTKVFHFRKGTFWPCAVIFACKHAPFGIQRYIYTNKGLQNNLHSTPCCVKNLKEKSPLPLKITVKIMLQFCWKFS